MAELCSMLQVSKPAIYEWIKFGKLKPDKIRHGFTFFGKIDS